MSKKKRVKKVYEEEGQFFALPHAILNHPDYISLSWAARSLLIDMGALWNGHNNGDISIPISIMKHRGWTSPNLIQKCKAELLAKDWIRLTRQGHNRVCSLYALSWKPLSDKGKEKLDIDPAQYKPRSLKPIS